MNYMITLHWGETDVLEGKCTAVTGSDTAHHFLRWAFAGPEFARWIDTERFLQRVLALEVGGRAVWAWEDETGAATATIERVA